MGNLQRYRKKTEHSKVRYTSKKDPEKNEKGMVMELRKMNPRRLSTIRCGEVTCRTLMRLSKDRLGELSSFNTEG